jgi:hypothetical protein
MSNGVADARADALRRGGVATDNGTIADLRTPRYTVMSVDIGKARVHGRGFGL